MCSPGSARRTLQLSAQRWTFCLCAARSPHIVQLLDVHQKGLVFELGEALPTMVTLVQLKVIMEHCCRGARLNSRTQAHLSFHMQDKGSQTRPPINTSEKTR